MVVLINFKYFDIFCTYFIDTRVKICYNAYTIDEYLDF